MRSPMLQLPTSVSVPSLMTDTSMVLLIPLFAGMTTFMAKLTNALPSLFVRQVAALLTVPHTVTLHLIIARYYLNYTYPSSK